MKKTIFFLLVFSSQINFSQNTNIFPDNGNVGIGTINPSNKLDIIGNVIWNGYNSGNPRTAKLGHSGGNYGGIGYNIDFTETTGLFHRPLADLSSYLEFTFGGFRFFWKCKW